jgi:iron(III) transport system substrate-binding protein
LFEGDDKGMNFKKNYIFLFLIFIIFCLLIGVVNKKGNQENTNLLDEKDKLVVFTSHKKEIYEPIIKAFEEETGIWVKVINGGTTKLLNRIEESNDKFLCDIMFGGSAESLENSKNYFLEYKCSDYDFLNTDIVSKDFKWTPFSNLPLVIIYNNKMVYSTVAPRGWQELLNFVWKGKVSFADPLVSGSSYTAIAILIQLLKLDEEEAIDNIIKQIGGSGESSSRIAVDNVSNGTKQIGITLESTAWQRIENGENLSVVYPIEGTSMIPDGTAILKNAKHIENAKKFIDFTVYTETQEMIVDRFYRRSIRKDVYLNKKITGDIQIVKFDIDWASNHKDDILYLWNEKNK